MCSEQVKKDVADMLVPGEQTQREKGATPVKQGGMRDVRGRFMYSFTHKTLCVDEDKRILVR